MEKKADWRSQEYNRSFIAFCEGAPWDVKEPPLNKDDYLQMLTSAGRRIVNDGPTEKQVYQKNPAFRLPASYSQEVANELDKRSNVRDYSKLLTSSGLALVGVRCPAPEVFLRWPEFRVTRFYTDDAWIAYAKRRGMEIMTEIAPRFDTYRANKKSIAFAALTAINRTDKINAILRNDRYHYIFQDAPPENLQFMLSNRMITPEDVFPPDGEELMRRWAALRSIDAGVFSFIEAGWIYPFNPFPEPLSWSRVLVPLVATELKAESNGQRALIRLALMGLAMLDKSNRLSIPAREFNVSIPSKKVMPFTVDPSSDAAIEKTLLQQYGVKWASMPKSIIEFVK